MADNKVTIWGGGLKFGRKPEDGEVLIGDGTSFEMSTLTPGPGVSISNTSGGIEISATGSGGTVTDVTATSPLASSGGATPDISLNGVVGVANGGTGASTLTAENVILGGGTNPVKFVAPGSSGNVLTSNGTTWASAAPIDVVRARGSLLTLTTTPTFGLGAVNITSVTSSGTGIYLVTFTTALASTDYQVLATITTPSAINDNVVFCTSKTTSDFTLRCYRASTAALTGTVAIDVLVIG